MMHGQRRLVWRIRKNKYFSYRRCNEVVGKSNRKQSGPIIEFLIANYAWFIAALLHNCRHELFKHFDCFDLDRSCDHSQDE